MTQAERRVSRRRLLWEALREAEERERRMREARDADALCYEACGLELRTVRPGPQCDEDGRAVLTLSESIPAAGDDHERRMIPMSVFDVQAVRRRGVDYEHWPIPTPGGG